MVAAILFLSFLAFFSVVPQMTGHRSLPEKEMAARSILIQRARLLNWDYVYERPARKSVIVDPEGVAQRSADGMQMTRRDRSRKIPLPPVDIRIEEPPPPAPAGPAPETTGEAPNPSSLPSIRLSPADSSEAPGPPRTHADGPLMPPRQPRAETEPSTEAGPQAQEQARQNVYRAIMDDEKLLDSVKSSIDVILVRGVITLNGIVTSEDDKKRLGLLAQETAQGAGVDNRLMVLNINDSL